MFVIFVIITTLLWRLFGWEIKDKNIMSNKYFKDLDVKFLEEKHINAKIVVEPFERGYAVTVGNALRRTLLTSLPGSAITSIKIDGVSHEFSTIKGVSTDSSDIILNLKKIRFKMFSGKG